MVLKMIKIRLPEGAEKELKIGSVISPNVAPKTLFEVIEFKGTDQWRTWEVKVKSMRVEIYSKAQLKGLPFSIRGEIIEGDKKNYLAKI